MILAGGRKNTRPIKRRRSGDLAKRKSKQYYYFIKAGGEEYEVCPKAYQSIHGVGESTIRAAYTRAQKSATGTPAPDQRGRR